MNPDFTRGRYAEILAIAAANGSVSTPQVCAFCNIDTQHAASLLCKLRRLGVLVASGKGPHGQVISVLAGKPSPVGHYDDSCLAAALGYPR